MRELFVYYRMAAAQAVPARAEVDRLQAGLRERHPGLQARLLRREAAPDGLQTWMEIYAWPDRAGGVVPGLQAEIERAAEALAPLIDGARHCEVFEPV